MSLVNCTSESFYNYSKDLFKLRHTFIGVCNEVMPEKIERPYVDLINKIIELEKMFNIVSSNDRELYGNRKTINKLDLNKPDSLKQISDFLSSKSEELSYNELKELSSVLEKLQQERKHYEKNLNQTNELENESLEISNDSGNIQERIKQQIQEIINLRLSLNAMGMDSRLDGLAITKKHIDEITSIPNLDDERKEELIRYLHNHTALRIAAFKCASSYADGIMNSYLNNDLSNNLDSVKPVTWDLLKYSIIADTDSFEKNVLLRNGVVDVGSRVNSFYDAVLGTINGEERDFDASKTLYGTGIGFKDPSLLSDLSSKFYQLQEIIKEENQSSMQM